MVKRVEKNNKSDNKARNLLILLAVFLILIAAGCVSAFFAWRTLFSGNRHFLLRDIVVVDSARGYWFNHRQDLIEYLQLKTGVDNIFSLNIRELRRKINDLPSVENCEISRVMPDTLRLSLVERIPRAMLGNPRSAWVIDASGIVIPRSQTLAGVGNLPVITGFGDSGELRAGMELPAAKPALDVLMRTVRSFPDISIMYMNVSGSDTLKFTMRYRNNRLYNTIMPIGGRTDYLLNILQSTIINLQHSGDRRNTIDLSFSGDAVIR